MLQYTLRSWAKLLLLVVIFLPAYASGQSSAKKEAVDLSILSQSDTLLGYMTPAQRIEYLKLETAIEAAESDLRSGQYMARTEPSSFDPNRDVKPIIERGKKLIASAQLSLDASQRKMVALLLAVDTQKSQQEATAETRFDYTLEATSYEDAMTTNLQKLLETCWDLKYRAIFFDGLFIQDTEGTRRAPAELRNAAYDTLVKIDGNRFTISTPMGFQLKADSLGKGGDIFSYENEAIFKNEKKALLILELILPEGSRTGLLSLRALDLNTLRVTAQEIVKINDMAAAIGHNPAELEDRIHDQISLRDPANTLELLSKLPTPYRFEVEAEPDNTEVAHLLSYTLHHNSGLKLTDSDFILRAYGESLDMPEAWQGEANASLTIKAGEQAGSYQLTAQAHGSARVLSAGILTLSQDSLSEAGQ